MNILSRLANEFFKFVFLKKRSPPKKKFKSFTRFNHFVEKRTHSSSCFMHLFTLWRAIAKAELLCQLPPHQVFVLLSFQKQRAFFEATIHQCIMYALACFKILWGNTYLSQWVLLPQGCMAFKNDSITHRPILLLLFFYPLFPGFLLIKKGACRVE